MENSNFWTRITSLYASQIWPAILRMYKSVLSIRITSLYLFQPSSVVFESKTVSFGPEKQISMGTTPHLSFCTCKTSTFGAELQLSMGLRPHLSFSACKTAWIATELLVSMGPSPHLWFLDAKQRLFDQNYKSLWVPGLTCRFVHAKQRDLHQIY